MAHDPEFAAAAYLGGAMGRRARTRFETHVLGCDECWSEVGAGRLGRSVAESAREAAPTHLRDRVRGVIEHAATVRAHTRRARFATVVGSKPFAVAGGMVTAAVVAIAAVGVSAEVGLGTRARGEPPVLAAALTAYRVATLPGKTMTHAAVPDLSRLGLLAIGASAGRLDTMVVDAYAYRDSTGRRVVVYFGKQSFPRPADARSVSSLADSWTASAAGVFMESSKTNRSMLVVGSDQPMVAAVDQSLNAA